MNAKTVVATLDFFAPVVDDPYTYGAIAAANAMSAMYAMGGEVLALNIAAFLEDLPVEVQTAVLRGGAEKVREAGGVIAGGIRSAPGTEVRTERAGAGAPEAILSKAGLRPGDALYLTKPLGTGTILSAQRQGKAQAAWVEAAAESMLRLNRHASHLAREAGLSAATDITGFGLLGHLWEMASRSGLSVEVEAGAVPLLPGALECSALGVHTGGEGRNRDWVGHKVRFAAGVDPDVAALLFDPQTSGGLLLAASPRKAKRLEAAFARDATELWRIGSATAGSGGLRITDSFLLREQWDAVGPRETGQ
ncbi:MAG: selenide, water dikinase SelD [Dehalococcoidia bacterium]